MKFIKLIIFKIKMNIIYRYNLRRLKNKDPFIY